MIKKYCLKYYCQIKNNLGLVMTDEYNIIQLKLNNKLIKYE
jgi:hypothetical protein